MKSRSKSNGGGSSTTALSTTLKVITAQALASFLGIALTKLLPGDKVSQLRKPLAGHLGMAQECAALLASPDEELVSPGVSAEELLSMVERSRFLSGQERVTALVGESVSQQRMLEDDKIMGSLFALARAAEAQAQHNPNILVRWGFVRDYIRAFRATGPRRPAKPQKKEDKNGTNGGQKPGATGGKTE